MSRFYKSHHNINPWRLKKGSLRYENSWISIFHDEVVTPGGSEGIYGTVHFKNQAIGIVPIDDEGNTWLVGQYRYPLKRWSWEIPEGGCPVGTDPLETARRELKEETGIEAKQWELISEFDLSNSVSDEIGFIYLATDLQMGPAQPEESEELELIKLPFKDALGMAIKGELTDALTLIGLFRAAQILDEITNL
jgi:8-oxo-dGTP pyrophosphatase MutT (NUDIX family)